MVDRLGIPKAKLETLEECRTLVHGVLDRVVVGGELVTFPELEGVPRPTKRDFHNVLHGWASSKARQKGVRAEFLLMRMMELTAWYGPEVFEWPDSRTFALVVKCYAGTTCKCFGWGRSVLLISFKNCSFDLLFRCFISWE